MAFEDYWNSVYKKENINPPRYDNWLEKYLNLMENVKTPILDLGAGLGNDSLFLTEKGFDVLSCDYAVESLNYIKKRIPNAKTMLVDISKKLPFNDDEFEIIIANLSLHYFDSKTTMEIMKELKRVLKKGGYLLARVNSTGDVNNGSGQGEKIEENYYFVEGYNKRFFTLKDAEKYFSIIGQVDLQEFEIVRYKNIKRLIEVKVCKN